MNGFIKPGSDVYSISVMVEVIAPSPQEAVVFVDKSLITDEIANDPKFVSFSVTAKSNEYSVTR